MWIYLICILWFGVTASLADDRPNGTALQIEHAPRLKDRFTLDMNKGFDDKPFYRPEILPPPSPEYTPDWKEEELAPTPFRENYYGEFERPYKLFPFTMSAAYWHLSPFTWDNPQLLGCYCCTVYKKVTPLATCAVLTTRHLLTTATSTELILREHGDEKTLEGILGAYYDITYYASNGSVYMTPARIHYHPKYLMPENVNASHPIPALFDLAIWAATVPFFHYMTESAHTQTYVCNRAGSYWLHFGSPTPGAVKQPIAIIVGFQFILWYQRKPHPSYKYAVKTRKYTAKCPKTEWGWFFCIWGRWAMLGLDSGAALHRATQGQSWMYDGLLAINAFSMDLRAKELTHYFIPLENHDVLEFMYDAYMGRLDYRYLDDRYYNSQWEAPIAKPWIYIPWKYDDYTLPTEWWRLYDPPAFF